MDLRREQDKVVPVLSPALVELLWTAYDLEGLTDAGLSDAMGYLKMNDPRLNADAPRIDVAGTDGSKVNIALASGKQHLVVFLAGCKPCSIRIAAKLGEFQNLHPGTQVSGVVPEEIHEIDRFRNANGIRVRLAQQVGTVVDGRYNLRWRPRVFLIDSRGKLSFAQPPTLAFNDAIRTISEMLRQPFVLDNRKRDGD